MKIRRVRELRKLIVKCMEMEDQDEALLYEPDDSEYPEYFRNLSDIADILDDNGFDIRKFKDKLVNAQFLWLNRNEEKIKNCLDGKYAGDGASERDRIFKGGSEELDWSKIK